MALTPSTAPTLARKLVKTAPYTRRKIHTASKAEQAGQQGATAERETITAKFARDIRQVEASIGQTRAKAADFDRAALIAVSGKTLPTSGPVSALVALALRIGADIDPTLPQIAAQRAAQAAEQAEARLDDAEPELRSTALLAQLSALLPAVKFDIKSPRVAGVRRDYLSATQIAADRRKNK